MEIAEMRQRVLDAAEVLFYGRGIQAVGMDEIRATAGVPLKRIYQFFPSKDDLIREVLAVRDQRWEEGLQRYVDAVDAPVDKMLAVFDWLAEWFEHPDFRGCSFINSFGELGSTSETVANAASVNKAHFRQQLAAFAAQAGLRPEIAAYVALLTEGAITTAAISGTPEPATQARAAARALIETAAGS